MTVDCRKPWIDIENEWDEEERYSTAASCSRQLHDQQRQLHEERRKIEEAQRKLKDEAEKLATERRKLEVIISAHLVVVGRCKFKF